MIPDGGMEKIRDYEFLIAVRNFRSKFTISETVAHELKHIATEILKPKRDRKDGKRKGPYKWEEVNCARAEKRWSNLVYFDELPVMNTFKPLISSNV